MTPPLDGVRIVDASTYLMGPFAAMMLADLGADVIKVEPPPRGDPYRSVGRRHRGVGVGAANVNRNKRSLALDLKDAPDRDTFLQLLGTVDGLITNWRPGVAERLGLADAVLAAANPGLVRLAVTGYGPDGPAAGRPAFDLILQAETGLAWLQGAGGRPRMLRTYIADKVTATLAVQALLAGLMSRHRSGRGSRIEVSMLEAVSYFNFPDVLESRTVLDGALPLPQPPADCIVATADGYLALAPVSGAQVRATLGALGHPEWMDEITRHAAFAQFAPVLMERIETITRTAPTTHWLRVFGDIDVPAAAVQDLDGHLADPQVAHLDIYWTCEHATLGPMRYARYPARFDGQRADGGSGSKPFPRPGEHNDELRGGVPALPAG